MADNIQVRLVHVEFLRPGPPHNQLLSPLTQYLATCGDAGAGVVTVPYEHAEFERRLKDLRYETGDPADRQAMLHSIGTKMGQMLGAIPGLSGALASDPARPDSDPSPADAVRLRARTPAVRGGEGADLGDGNGRELALDSDAPADLLDAEHPDRVARRCGLARSSADPLHLRQPGRHPFKEHREALLERSRPSSIPDRMTTRGTTTTRASSTATADHPRQSDAERRVSRVPRRPPYTHVHILTHGDLSETSPDSYGLVLRGETMRRTSPRGRSVRADVGGGRIHRPAVVTVASCDSGNVGTVVIPGASFAHALHQAGIRSSSPPSSR